MLKIKKKNSFQQVVHSLLKGRLIMLKKIIGGNIFLVQSIFSLLVVVFVNTSLNSLTLLKFQKLLRISKHGEM